MADPSPSLDLKVQLAQMMLTAHCQKKRANFYFQPQGARLSCIIIHIWTISRGTACSGSSTISGHVMTSTSVNALPHTAAQRERVKQRKKWKLTCCQGFKVSRLLLSRHSLPNYDLLFTLSKICHKNRFTSRTDLSKLSKYDSPVSCFDTSASPSGWFSSNTARLNVSEVTQEPWLVDTLVTVWSKMARRFPAKRQTSELPWKQTASQTSRKLF